MVVVGDKKGPQYYQINEGKNGRVIYLNTNDQKELERAGVKLLSLLPWDSFGRKNLGYLYAIASGDQLIWDFDDDNAKIAIIASKNFRTKRNAFNFGSQTKTKQYRCFLRLF